MIIIIKIFVCENSVDGIFTAIYKAWSSGYGHANCKLQEQSTAYGYANIELFSEYISISTDFDLSMKVARSIKTKLSEEIFEMVYKTAISDQVGKADLIYRFLILGFAKGPTIVNQLNNEIVNRLFKISRNVSGEVHHFLGFVRFAEQENGLLTSIIHPKNNVISLIMPHFVDRLSTERFLIYDEDRKIAALHSPGKPWILSQIDFDKEDLNRVSFEEDDYQSLWKSFFEHIAIQERINPKLQRNNLPLRFRGDMVEFKTSQ